MKLLGVRQLSVLLAGTLLLCHGIFGALHLICYSPLCVDGAEHTAEHKSAAGALGDTHEHSADHEASTESFAVLVFGLLGLLVGLLLRRAVAEQTRHALVRSLSPGARRIPSSTNPHITHSSGVQALRGSSPR